MPSVHQSCLCFQHTGAIPHCFLSYPPSFHSQHANWLADHRSSADWLADHKSITSPSSSTICTWYSSNFGRVPQAYRCHWILTSNTSSLILVRRALIGWWHHVIFYFNFQGKLIYCQFNWRLCLHLCLPCIEDKRSAMIGTPSFFSFFSSRATHFSCNRQLPWGFLTWCCLFPFYFRFYLVLYLPRFSSVN
jgi:hypothetical protein